MFPANPKPGLAAVLLNARPGGSPWRADPWEALDQLGRDIQSCSSPAQALSLTLAAVQLALGADTVFACSAERPEPAEVIGRVRPALEWCRDFARNLLSEAPGTDSQLLRSHLLRPSGMGDEFPRSAAMVRVSKSRTLWLGALNFDPERTFSVADVRAMSLARRMLVNYHQQVRLQEGLKETVLGLIHSFVAVADARDCYTGSHSERVARIALRLGQEMQLPGSVLSDLYVAGLLHDAGKIGVRDEVLSKPGPLTDEERVHAQEHVILSETIISRIKQLRHLCPAIRGHHERWDGKGYPDGLAGNAIPLGARILAVADSCDAMLSPRPYRPCRTAQEVETVLAAGAGKQWDPEVVSHFRACREEVYAFCRQGSETAAGATRGEVAEVPVGGSSQ